MKGPPSQIVASLRIAAVTMLICGLYTLLVLAAARVFTRASAEGSLVHDSRGNVAGSALIAQGFSKPEYLWPRPSAVDYDAAGAGGSNFGPAGEAMRERAVGAVVRFGLTGSERLPVDLAT